ncbi:unnamed protein product, partial [Linum tenue]
KTKLVIYKPGWIQVQTDGFVLTKSGKAATGVLSETTWDDVKAPLSATWVCALLQELNLRGLLKVCDL